MLLTLKDVRLAFANIWEPKQFNGQGEPACSASFLLERSRQQDLIKLTQEVIQQVAQEKWGAKAGDILKTLIAKGDVCLHDGNTKAEYAGFSGNLFVSGRNKGRPAVVHKAKYQGKVIAVDQHGNGYIDGRRVDLPFEITAPYSGCYVNVNLDVWAQENGYGKRINAKILGIQFNRDGEAFSGGAGFDEAQFDYGDDEAGQGGAPSDNPFESGDTGFNFGGDEPAKQNDGFFN